LMLLITCGATVPMLVVAESMQCFRSEQDAPKPKRARLQANTSQQATTLHMVAGQRIESLSKSTDLTDRGQEATRKSAQPDPEPAQQEGQQATVQQESMCREIKQVTAGQADQPTTSAVQQKNQLEDAEASQSSTDQQVGLSCVFLLDVGVLLSSRAGIAAAIHAWYCLWFKFHLSRAQGHVDACRSKLHVRRTAS
jgi:hypothetical protein